MIFSRLNLWQRSRSAGAGGVCFKLLLAVAGLAVVAAVFLPVYKCTGQRVPQGQFRADLHTLAAMVRYVFTPSPAVKPVPVLPEEPRLAMSQTPAGNPPEMLAFSTNSLWPALPSWTNGPGQS